MFFFICRQKLGFAAGSIISGGNPLTQPLLYLSACTIMSVYICLSVVSRSSMFLNCRSVTVCMKCAGSGEEDAESERVRAEGYAHKSDRLG